MSKNNEKNLNGSSPNQDRTVWEQEAGREKKRFLVRKQEEREQQRALKDFLRHLKEEGWE